MPQDDKRFGPGALQTITQSELNRLVETQAALREALRPFATFAEALPSVIPGQERLTDAGPAFTCKSPRDPCGPERIISFADLRHALTLCKQLDSQDEQRFISRIERKMAGVSETCIALGCGTPIPGSERYHLAGYCSETCELKALRDMTVSPDPESTDFKKRP